MFQRRFIHAVQDGFFYLVQFRFCLLHHAHVAMHDLLKKVIHKTFQARQLPLARPFDLFHDARSRIAVINKDDAFLVKDKGEPCAIAGEVLTVRDKKRSSQRIDIHFDFGIVNLI